MLKKESGTWNDALGIWSKKRAAIYKRSMYKISVESSSASLPSPLPKPQSSSVHIFDGFEYFIDHTKRDWDDQEKAAVAWGGHLASIHSDEELAFILGIRQGRKRYYFLGGKRKDVAGKWTWTDGTPWSYENWDEGEPNNNKDVQDHLMIKKNGTWNDVLDDELGRGILKLAAIFKRSVGGNSMTNPQRNLKSKGFKLHQPFRNEYYYTYEGSLTTPPCSEIVYWNVLDTPMRISHSQFKRLKDLIKYYLDDSCILSSYADSEGRVARPLQKTRSKHKVSHCDESDYSN